MSVGHRSESFECSLHDALGPDIDPTSRSHLAVHHQTHAFQLMKMFPVRPGADQVRVRDQNTKRVFVSTKNSDGLS